MQPWSYHFSLVQDIFSLVSLAFIRLKKGNWVLALLVVYFFMRITAPTNATAMITAIAAPIIVQV